MSHVALFIPRLQGGGAERVTLELARGFAARGHRTDLVLCRREGALADHVDPSVNVIELGCSTARAAVVPLAGYLREEAPQALLSAMTHANLAALFASRLARTRTRVVVVEHNAVRPRIDAARGLRVRAGYRAVGAAYRRWADAVVCVSEGVADDLSRNVAIPRGDLDVIYNPIVTDRLAAALREEVDHPALADGSTPLVAVGRLTHQKGFDLLVEAFALVRSRRRVRLVILGEGEDRWALQAQARRLGLGDDVVMPGFVANPYAWMARAGAFVLSSRWEGLPTVLVEALAAGAPVAAFDCPFGPHEILQAGRWGHLAPPLDVPALADAIVRALDDGRRPDLVAARHERASDFTPEVSVTRYLELLVDGPQRPAVGSSAGARI